MSEFIIEVKQLSLNFNEVEVLRNVSFELKRGDWLTIIGHNGSGKTSLLKSILGFHQQAVGEIFFDSKSLHSLNRQDLAKLMSYVPQKPPSDLDMSVIDFLFLARYPYRDDFERRIRDKIVVEEVVQDLALEKLRERTFSQLSGGEQQKVMIAAALIQETPILLLDEPGAFLDPCFRATTLGHLKKICKLKNITVLEVSHDINTTSTLADRFIALKSGEIIFDLKIEALLSKMILEQIYDQTFEILHDEKLQLKAALPTGGRE